MCVCVCACLHVCVRVCMCVCTCVCARAYEHVFQRNGVGELFVQCLEPGGSAAFAGVREADVIEKVDGENITGMAIRDAVLLIGGPQGSSVSLVILRGSNHDRIEINMTRARRNLFSTSPVLALPHSRNVSHIGDDVAGKNVAHHSSSPGEVLLLELDKLHKELAGAESAMQGITRLYVKGGAGCLQKCAVLDLVLLCC